jgi:predicted acetyltransferase
MCSWKIVEQLLSLDLVAAYNELNDINSKDKNWMRIMNDKVIFEHHCKNNNIDIDSTKYIDYGNNFALEKVNKTGIRDGQIEHAWERVFGLVAENLGSKFLIIN